MEVAIHPLDPRDLERARQILADACHHDRAALVAEEKLFGPGGGGVPATPLGAWRGETLVGVAVVSGRWLRLLAVAPDARGAGVGTALLEEVESRARAAGESLLRTMDQGGNYLAPGVARENGDTIRWLERRGFVENRTNTNLLIELTNNPAATRARAEELARACLDRGYRVERGDPSRHLPACAEAIAGEFSPGWAVEITNAISNPPGAAHLAFHADSGDLVGFAAHDGNNRGLGWFGPAGTWPAHRGKRLGEALLVACLADVAEAGHSHCTIAWIGPRDFYDRVAGVAGDRQYVVMTKELKTP